MNFGSPARTRWHSTKAKHMSKTPVVIIVGADKGGVGKTMVSRALLDYLKANAIPSRAFDTEVPTGDLKRFFPRADLVDLTDSDGQMKIFDTLGESVTLIDIRAGLLSPTLKTLAEIGFLDPAKCRIIVLHVLGNSQASVNEVQAITAGVASSRYIAVGNHINDTKFNFPANALNIPMLNVRACESVDADSTSFQSYIGSDASPVLRGYVKHWLGLVFAQFDAVQLTAQ
jgi:hypothetical protein